MDEKCLTEKYEMGLERHFKEIKDLKEQLGERVKRNSENSDTPPTSDPLYFQSQRKKAEVQSHLVFPTRVTTISWQETEEMNAELLSIFDGNETYQREDYLESSDSSNMLDMCETVPAIAKLRDLFFHGLSCWMKAEGIAGKYTAQMLMFPVYSLPGQFVPAHNHLAHVSAVYYVRTDNYTDHELVEYGDAADYFRSDGGILLLHDPRFNASLMDLTKRDSVKIFPRPGLMVVLPGYLWHSGTPNYSGFNRLAIVGDFLLQERSSQRTHSFEFSCEDDLDIINT